MLEPLLRFIAETSFEDFPPAVIEQAKRCFLDWAGVTVGGAAHPASSILIDLVKDLGGKEQASILGTSLKTSMVNAALVNGAMSHVLDFDDTHLMALMHPSAPLLPAILAFGEHEGANGRDFLTAFVVGFETETRISLSMGASHYDRGWHSTATMGRFGAAAGVAKLMRLDAGKMGFALGLAGTQTSGIRKVFGSMAKSFHPGKAAFDGLLSALLARKGYTSSENILAGEKGLGALLSGDFQPSRGLEGLGRRYLLEGLSFKPYASCLYTHPAIDAVIHLRNKHGIDPKQVDRISCRVAKFCFDAACISAPQTGLEGKFSTAYCIAIALREGRADESQFKDNLVKDPAIAEFIKKIRVEQNSDLSDKEAEVIVHLKDGKVLNRKVAGPLGNPDNPLPNRALEEKAAGLLGTIFPEEKIGRIFKKIWALESLDHISELTEMLVVKESK
jgi:2-methylcitrate dehydratase PrpD